MFRHEGARRAKWARYAQILEPRESRALKRVDGGAQHSVTPRADREHVGPVGQLSPGEAVGHWTRIPGGAGGPAPRLPAGAKPHSPQPTSHVPPDDAIHPTLRFTCGGRRLKRSLVWNPIAPAGRCKRWLGGSCFGTRPPHPSTAREQRGHGFDVTSKSGRAPERYTSGRRLACAPSPRPRLVPPTKEEVPTGSHAIRMFRYQRARRTRRERPDRIAVTRGELSLTGSSSGAQHSMAQGSQR
jgi:hypothetical protein